MKSTLVEYFVELVKIDSESGNELKLAEKLKADLEDLGARVRFDNAHLRTGGNVGNLYAYIPGSVEKKPLLLCAHMDTVVPGVNINPRILDDRIVSDGTTVLGGDDKSGIAEIIWAVKELKSRQAATAPVEILLTVSEEIGLTGAKHFDYSLLKSEIGFALDGQKVGHLTIGAPSQNTIEINVPGREAHAGVEPEKGVNAIKLAAEAVCRMPSGRIDPETTCNIGLIKGGKATNIVPNQVLIKAEARSHDQIKLATTTESIVTAAEKTISATGDQDLIDRLEIKQSRDYDNFRFSEETDVVTLGLKAAKKLGLPAETSIGGGGSDANIFNQKDLRVVIAGTGMSKVHTVNEFILRSDLENGCRWISEIIQIYSDQN